MPRSLKALLWSGVGRVVTGKGSAPARRGATVLRGWYCNLMSGNLSEVCALRRFTGGLVVHRHCIDGFWWVVFSCRRSLESGQCRYLHGQMPNRQPQPHAQVRTTGMPAGLRRNDRSGAYGQLSGQEALPRDPFGAGAPGSAGDCRRHRGCLASAPGTGPDAEGALVDADIGLGTATVERLRKRCVLEGLDAALSRKEQVNRRPKRLDGAMEAKLIALFVPARGLWTLKLLAGRLVEMEIVERISEETVRKTLKKEIKPWLKQYWCIPPHRSAQFVAADMLDIYQRNFAGDEVLETSRQQTKETPRPPVSRRWSTMNMSATARPTSSWPLRPTRTGAR